MQWLELGILAEFADRSGVIRQTAGCSLAGRFEFARRLEQLQVLLERLSPEQAWADEYYRGGQFAHVIDRLLALNGLETDWLTLDMVSSLLFARLEVDGTISPGWLVELNNPAQSHRQTSGDSQTLAQSIAGLTESLTEALELAEGMPAHLLIDIAAARSELHKTDDQKAQDKKQRIFEELKNNARLEEVIGG